MVRALIIFSLAAFGALLVALLVDNPGQVTVNWLGYRLETAMSLMAILLAIGFGIVLVVLRIIKLILGGPGAWRRFFGKVRARQGMGALTQGLAAVAAGDASEASRHAITAERLAREGPLARVLALEAAELEGRSKDVASLAQALLEHSETFLLGRRALFDLARKAGQEAAAVDEAEAAFENHPAAGWAAQALLADAIDAQDWARGKSIFARANRFGAFINGRAARVHAALLQAEAMDHRTRDELGKAASLAKKAHETDTTFAPALILVAEIYGEQGKVKRAQKLIEDAWDSLPHPALGRIYAELLPEERQIETLERLRGLVNINGRHVESHLLFAQYAIAARNFAAGRDALKGLLLSGTSARAFAAMATLDRAELGMAEASEEWIAKALAAPRDDVWVCTACGHRQRDWLPVCAGCHTVGSAEWATHLAMPGEAVADTPSRDEFNLVEVTPPPELETSPEAVAATDAPTPTKIEGPKERPSPEPAAEIEAVPFDPNEHRPDDPGLPTDKDTPKSLGPAKI